MTRKMPPPSDLADKFMLRLPDGMRDRIRDAAERNNRSMNAEIIDTLQEAYPEEISQENLHSLTIAELVRAKNHKERIAVLEKSNKIAERNKFQFYYQLSSRKNNPNHYSLDILFGRKPDKPYSEKPDENAIKFSFDLDMISEKQRK